MSPVLQNRLPAYPWMDPRLARLPGIIPLAEDDWIDIDDAYAGQMALRDRLIAECPERVHALTEAARPAADELYEAILKLLPGLGFHVGEGEALRPDGLRVPLDRGRPLLTLGRLVQEDLCLMEAGPDDEHVLTGAILCFPSHWTLAEKLGHPLTRIHGPVPEYRLAIAARVQRLFDAIRPEQPLWRMNAHPSASASLFTPLREAERHPPKDRLRDPYIRCERQCLLRLPRTRAVVFSIHTYMVAAEGLPPDVRQAFVCAGNH